MNLPIAFPATTQSIEGVQVLAADLGGTKINIALYQVANNQLQPVIADRFHSRDFPSFLAVIKAFYQKYPQVYAQHISVGVAGPVIDGVANIVNLNWIVSAKEIADESGVPVMFLNDLEVTAYGLACLSDADFVCLHTGKEHHHGNIGIVAPGTGLGEAGLFWNGAGYHPFATEGGHTDFAPRTEEDIALYRFIKQTEKVVSIEHILSGPGIVRLFNYMQQVVKMPVAGWLQDAMQGKDASAVISTAAIEGSADICVATMQLFVHHLARECSNLALKFKAIGGLYISGGIPPKIIPLLQKGNFVPSYLDCDRMQDLTEQIPIYVVMNDQAPLLGAAWYGAHQCSV